MMQQRAPRAGVTLIELLVVLVVLAITTAVAALALPAPAVEVDPEGARERIAVARRAAIASGKAVLVFVPLEVVAPAGAVMPPGSVERSVVAVTALPDGSVLAPATLGIARLTGSASRTGTEP